MVLQTVPWTALARGHRKVKLKEILTGKTTVGWWVFSSGLMMGALWGVERYKMKALRSETTKATMKVEPTGT